MFSRCSLDFSVGVGTFVIGLSQISSIIKSIVLVVKNWFCHDRDILRCGPL